MNLKFPNSIKRAARRKEIESMNQTKLRRKKRCESAKELIRPRMPNFQQSIDSQIERNPIGQTLGIGDFWVRMGAANRMIRARFGCRDES